MHNKLLTKAFDKAEQTIKTNKVSPRARLLSDYIFNVTKEQYGERILREKFNAIKKENSVIRLKKHAEEGLCHFLNYNSYEDFVYDNATVSEAVAQKKQFHLGKHKITIMVSISLLALFLIYKYYTRPRWMIWDNDHYVEVRLDLKQYNMQKLRAYKEDDITVFKKIRPNCSYNFFNNDGSVNLWYGKNKNKTLEFFTALGLHPETGKTLRPITQYMIRKYICK